jgi:hypothetical protein
MRMVLRKIDSCVGEADQAAEEAAMLAPLLWIALAVQAPQEPPIIVEGLRPQEKAVCRTERETGSRMVKKICRTATEQKQANLKARSTLMLGNRSTEPTEAFVRPKGD